MNGNGKVKIESLDEKIKVKEEEVEVVVLIGFVQDFCPYSGYHKNMTDEEALVIKPCVQVGKAACRTHNYDPNHEL